jgi:hypothetical protein
MRSPVGERGSELSIECDRMMALTARKTIYLFDVYLLASLFGRAAFALRLAKSGGGTPKNACLRRGDTPSDILCEFPRPITCFVAQNSV